MELIEKIGDVEIWAVQEIGYVDYYVYGATSSGDPLVCPSLGLARARAASYTSQ